MQDHRFSPERLRKLILGTIFLLAAIIVANGAIIVQLRQNMLAEVQSDLLRQSLALSELVDHTFQSVDLVLGSVAEKVLNDIGHGESLQESTNDKYDAFLKEKKNELPQINSLGILDSDGKRLSHSRDWLSASADFSSRKYFQVLKGDPSTPQYISEPLKVASGRWVVALVRPLTVDGKLIGVLYASTVLHYFEDLFRSTALGEGYAATLLREDGTLLARYPVAGKIGAIVPASVLQNLIDSRSGLSRAVSPIDHQARIAAAYRLAHYPLVIVVTQSEQAAFASWRTAAFTMGLVTFLVEVMIILAACLIARSWKQQDRLNAARANVIEADKNRALAEIELKRQRDLAEQSMRLSAAIENMTQGLCMFDSNGRLLFCNSLYAEMYRLPPELRQPGTPLSDIVAHCVGIGLWKDGQQDVEAAERHISDMLQASVNKKASWIREFSDGKLIRLSRQILPAGGWVTTHEDMTDQQRAEQELDETKRFLDSIVENIPVAVVVKDAKTRKYILVNRAFETMLDMPRSEVLGRSAFDIFGARDAELINNTDTESLQDPDGVKFKELEVHTPMRGLRIQATHRIVIRDRQDEPKCVIAVIEDITERKKSEQRIAFLAHHDALTGLANRAALTQKIDEAAARQRRRGEPFSVLLLDLDRFKQVNDTMGHPAGDRLLTEVATRLKTLLRETDVLARLGGDEFAIIQAGESNPREAASALADRIIEMLGKPFAIEGGDISIGTSIGIALAPEHDTAADILLKMADLALYRAKSAGRNGYRFFNAEMSEVASARQEIESDLRRALQQGELELHYQPIVDSRTRRMCSAEALVRWRHPTKGLILPDLFIPLAEETGLITQIGEWVLHEACAEAATWPDRIKVAVNLSLVQFHKTKLTDVVTGALAKAGLDPERLELEITETALLESAAECLPALRQFKNLGITIVLDDFGTGYSSLSQLALFPFDRIKIDKSFTQNLTKRSECAAIISATLTLAQSLDIATTAEGVETVDQYRILRLAGVTSLQGYLFKRPVPASELDFAGVYGDLAIDDAA